MCIPSSKASLMNNRLRPAESKQRSEPGSWTREHTDVLFKRVGGNTPQMGFTSTICELYYGLVFTLVCSQAGTLIQRPAQVRVSTRVSN